MIRSHRTSATKELIDGYCPVSLPSTLAKKARRCLLQLQLAVNLEDMKSPPGNKLHALTGKRKGFHAISINDQYRLIFRWKDGDAHDVEVLDYHDEKK